MLPACSFPPRRRHRGVPARISSLLLLLNRSPLVKLLPEARIISNAGFARSLQWAITTVTGLGAYDAVSGASTVTQVAPFLNSITVNVTGGQPLAFLFKYGGSDTPDHFQVVGTLPPGLVQTRSTNSKTDSITGVPIAVGSFPITIRAWRDANQTSNSKSSNFTINLASPPAPAITIQPDASNPTTIGGFIKLAVTQANGFTFTWKKNGVELPVGESTVFGRSAPRRFFFPTADPGTAWRSGDAFNDSTWTSVSGGIGYDTDTGGVNFLPHIATGGNVQAKMKGSGKPASVHLRIPFTVTSRTAFSYLKLRVQCDDGFVAWLNGTEISSQSKPANLLWNSAATSGTNDNAAVTWREVDIPYHLGLLRAGENLLAVQAMNSSNTSSDLLFNCELAAGINSTNSARLILTGIQPADSGDYTVTITNPVSSITSNPAAVILPPMIDTQPAAVSINSGTTAQLIVAAALPATVTYQWYDGISGDTANPVPGATEAVFTTPPLTQTTTYWVRVTNAAGTADSNAATVIVTVTDPYTLWRGAQFPSAAINDPVISGPAADPDRDGLSNEAEYVFGTTPLTTETLPVPVISVTAGQPILTFVAQRAVGAGYSGRTRVYSLESTTNPDTGPWEGVQGFISITGDDQTVSYAPPAGDSSRFFHLKVRLTP